MESVATSLGPRLFQRKRLQTPQEALHPEAVPGPPEPPPRRKRPVLSALSGFVSFLVIGALAAGGALIYVEHELDTAGPLDSDKVVVIAPRTDVPEIVSELADQKVISSSLLFNAALLVSGKRSSVKAGEYAFRAHVAMREVMDILVSGRQVLHTITIPEGLTSAQVIQRLTADDVLAGDVTDVPPEGTLLPETYKFARGMTRSELLRKMQDDQKKLLAQVWSRRAPDLNLHSPQELVTLASIVEKETGKVDERPHVASVFLNRLAIHMRLQSDPTIVYGLVGGRGTLGRPILASEVSQPSPYNTYVIDGLPPGPIANPGRAAMEAVANPSRTKDLYFVADGTGGHAFSETLDQHNKNVARYRALQKEKQPAELVDTVQTPQAAPASDPAAAASAPAGASPAGPAPDPAANGPKNQPKGKPARQRRG